MCAAGIAILVAFTVSAGAQDNASLTGTVTDPSGAAVVNASITITNVATGQARNTVSNSTGDFLFANRIIGAGTAHTASTRENKLWPPSLNPKLRRPASN